MISFKWTRKFANEWFLTHIDRREDGTWIKGEAVSKRLEDLFDYFENRSCRTCKYITLDEHECDCDKDVNIFGGDMNFIPTQEIDTFYCKYWEKDNK